MNPAMNYVREYVRLLAVAAIAACGGFAFHAVYGWPALEVAVPVAAVVPVALAVVWSWWRVPLGFAMLLSAVCWLIVVGATVVHTASPTVLRHGLFDSWWQILTTVTPVPRDPELLVGVHALIWFGSAAGAEAVLRAKASLGAAAPPILVLVAGLVFSGGVSSSDTLLAGLAVFATGVLILLGQSGQALRTLASGAALVSAVALIAAVLGPQLPFVKGRQPFDPRSHITPASATQPTASPLDEISAWLAEPSETLFTAQLPPGTSPTTWRLAVLDRFDGTDWTQSGSLQTTGGRVPADSAQSDASAGSAEVRQVVRVAALRSEWLPTLGRASQVSGVAVDVDTVSGVVLTRNPLQTGEQYTVDSQPNAAVLSQARDAELASDAQATYLPPHAPAVIAQTAQEATAGSTFPAQQAVRLADYLRTNETYDPHGAPGHTYGHIAYFLSQSHRGTPEQFATAYALMARSIGLPSRVVVGFAGDTQAADGTWQVRGADALAWPEVEFAGIGWVPFFPTPSASAANGLRSLAAGETQQQSQLDEQIAAAAPAPAAAPQPKHRTTTEGTGPNAGFPWWATAILALVLLLTVGYVGAVILVPVQRRSRRRRLADPAARIVGAWHQTLEQLRVLGFTPAAAGTAPEVARHAAGHVSGRCGFDPADSLVPLARLTDLAVFAAGAATVRDAQSAWSHQDAFSAAARAAVPLRLRVLRRARPVTLRGR